MTTTSENLQLVLDTLESSNEMAPVLSAAEQCFIKRNITMFSEASRVTANRHGWQSFLSLQDDDTEALMSKLTSGGNNNRSLMRLTTLEKASLVPKIRFYKVIRDASTGKAISEIPITFPDSAKTNIDAMLSNSSQRGDDIAIKSFTFDFKNQNPFGAGRMVDSTLVLTMLNGESLVKERGIAGGSKSFKFSDLIVRNNRTNPEESNSDFYEIKANVGYELPDGNNGVINNQLRNDLENTQLSIILSLLDYDLTFGQNGTLTLTLSYQSRTEAVVSSPRKYNLFVDTVFDASSATMRAKSKGTIKEDLGRISAIEKKMEKARTATELKLRNMAYVQTPAYEPTPQVRMDTKKKIEQTLKESLQEYQIQIDGINGKITESKAKALYLANKNRVNKYNTILENLFKARKVRRISIPRQGLMMYGEAFDNALSTVVENLHGTKVGGSTLLGTVATGAAILVEAEAKRIELENSLKDQITSSIATSKASAAADVLADLEALALAEAIKHGRSSPLPQDYNNSLSNWLPSDAKTTDRNEKIIYWFYYGDLLDEALKMNDVHIQLFKDKIVPTIGPIILLDKNEKPHTVNIADIPIALHTFIDFFMKNVINQALDVYPASDFIRDTIQRLVMPCLNMGCFGNEAKDPKILKVATFDLPVKGKRTEPLTNGKFGSIIEPVVIPKGVPKALEAHIVYAPSYSARLDLTTVMKKNKKIFGNYGRLAKKTVDERYSYFLFYGNSKNQSINWRGDEEKDRKKGIYHFYLGSDRGLINQINFQKTQDSKIAMVMAERALKAGRGRIELWRNFSASLSTIGNTLVKPGCFLYINPSIAGLGDIRRDKDSLARQMGLGGYYMVLAVSNTIDDSGWRTNISAEWQSVPPINWK